VLAREPPAREGALRRARGTLTRGRRHDLVGCIGADALGASCIGPRSTDHSDRCVEGTMIGVLTHHWAKTDKIDEARKLLDRNGEA
jgi:hypothetical protein